MTGEKDILIQGDANDEEKRTEGVVTPSAHDVKAIFRRSNMIFGVGLAVLAIIGIVSVVVAVSGRAAARDSYNSTNVALANQERSACITERRNLQNDAAGRISIYANEAEVAGLVNNDEAEALRMLALFDQAVADWQAATASLTPEVQDAPKSEGGCGPPIITLDDLEQAG